MKERVSKPPVIISDLIRGAAEQRPGLIQAGDIILAVNGQPLVDLSYDSALEVLRGIASETHVVLILRGPEGFTTHLETTFTGGWDPKTIRVTRPLGPPTAAVDLSHQASAGRESRRWQRWTGPWVPEMVPSMLQIQGRKPALSPKPAAWLPGPQARTQPRKALGSPSRAVEAANCSKR